MSTIKTLITRLLWVVGTLAGIAIAGTALLVVYLWLHTGDKQLPFDKKEWIYGTNGNQMHFPRLEMADDLIAKKTLYRMDKKDVVLMLGEATKMDIQWGEKEHFDLLYWLGPERGFMSVDSEWLGIAFDNKGKVLEYKLVRD